MAREQAGSKHESWWQPKQFENPANADTHARTTAVEILEDFADISLDYWVSGFGTGGTLNGVSRTLKAKSLHTKIMVCEPDNGERYLTTPLFDDVVTEMSEEEKMLSRSTPGYRFDVSTPPAAVSDEVVELDPEAVKAVRDIISDSDNPVVMFALEWCEFCWSLRKALTEYGIAYRSVDLDAVEYQEDDRDGKIRASLRAHTGSNTFPQIFIKGEYMGRATELFDGIKDGEVQCKLSGHQVAYDESVKTDPYSFLPGWLHPR